MNQQPDLIPMERTTANVTVTEDQLAATANRLRALGAVILGFSVKGSSYTLSVILPPGEVLEQLLKDSNA
jgi:hypothetical protein